MEGERERRVEDVVPLELFRADHELRRKLWAAYQYAVSEVRLDLRASHGSRTLAGHYRLRALQLHIEVVERPDKLWVTLRPLLEGKMFDHVSDGAGTDVQTAVVLGIWDRWSEQRTRSLQQ